MGDEQVGKDEGGQHKRIDIHPELQIKNCDIMVFACCILCLRVYKLDI